MLLDFKNQQPLTELHLHDHFPVVSHKAQINKMSLITKRLFSVSEAAFNMDYSNWGSVLSTNNISNLLNPACAHKLNTTKLPVLLNIFW